MVDDVKVAGVSPSCENLDTKVSPTFIAYKLLRRENFKVDLCE